MLKEETTLYEITNKPFVSEGLTISLEEKEFYKFIKKFIKITDLNEEQIEKLKISDHVIIRRSKEIQ